MSGWQRHEGLAVALAMDNVDTDQLIPARFMSAPRSAGYGGFLLHDLRGPDFALDSTAAQGASILIAGRNFGCGSSREAAVYALVDAGFRAVIAPGFGEIFAANAVNNGLLPARMDTSALLGLPPCPAWIDLGTCEIGIAGQVHRFALDPVWQAKLINGWDDIDLTASFAGSISAYATKRREQAPWLWATTKRGDAPPTGRQR